MPESLITEKNSPPGSPYCLSLLFICLLLFFISTLPCIHLQFTSLQFYMVLRKAHMPSTQFHCSSGCMAMALSQIRCSSDCMATALSRPFKEYRQAPPPSTPLSSKRSMVRFSVLSSSTLHVDLPRRKPRMMAVLSTNVPTRSFPFTRACPGRYTHKRFRRRAPAIGLPITFFTFCSKLIEYARMKARMV